MAELTHLDEQGNARMVDVGLKPITRRVAVASGVITMSPVAFAHIEQRTAKKGDVLAIAQIAGIQGTKRTSDLIPLCHPLPISAVDVQLRAANNQVTVTVTATADWRTGVEMEALVGVNAALLTVYDMLKAVDRSMSIGDIRLLEKRGGKSGDWLRKT